MSEARERIPLGESRSRWGAHFQDMHNYRFATRDRRYIYMKRIYNVKRLYPNVLHYTTDIRDSSINREPHSKNVVDLTPGLIGDQVFSRSFTFLPH